MFSRHMQWGLPIARTGINIRALINQHCHLVWLADFSSDMKRSPTPLFEQSLQFRPLLFIRAFEPVLNVFLDVRISAFADPEQARKDFINRQPMGRLATADEIAPTVVFLASDESSFYSGEALHVNGGMTI